MSDTILTRCQKCDRFHDGPCKLKWGRRGFLYMLAGSPLLLHSPSPTVIRLARFVRPHEILSLDDYITADVIYFLNRDGSALGQHMTGKVVNVMAKNGVPLVTRQSQYATHSAEEMLKIVGSKVGSKVSTMEQWIKTVNPPLRWTMDRVAP